MSGPRRGAAESGGEFASVPITVANENIAGVRITTGLGGTVKGRVVFEGTAPRTGGFGPLRVMAQADDPQMPMFGMGMMFGGGGMADGSIADDGAFELGGVTGSVLFRVNAPPSLGAQIRDHSGGGHDGRSVRIQGGAGPVRRA